MGARRGPHQPARWWDAHCRLSSLMLIPLHLNSNQPQGPPGVSFPLDKEQTPRTPPCLPCLLRDYKAPLSIVAPNPSETRPTKAGPAPTQGSCRSKSSQVDPRAPRDISSPTTPRQEESFSKWPVEITIHCVQHKYTLTSDTAKWSHPELWFPFSRHFIFRLSLSLGS